MRVVFLNIDKKSIDCLNNNVKYVLITEDLRKINEFKKYRVKPIVILYNGTFVIDLENNHVIIEKPIDEKSTNKILKYSNNHNVDASLYKYEDNVFEIKLMCDNYHRRLIIPYMFKDKLPSISTLTSGKSIYIINKKASLISAIDEVLNYLNIKNNFIDLENLYTNISSEGYYKDRLNWKGFELYES